MLENLNDEKEEGNPTTADSGERKPGQKDRSPMVRDGGKDGDGSHGVEHQVVDCHGKLETSPLLPALPPHCDRERLADDALH